MSNTPRVPSDPPRRGRFWRCVALLVALIGLGLVAGLGGCQPKKTLSDAGDTVSQYAKGLGGSATKVGTRTGELIGLVEKKWDYVRLAYGAGETPVKLQAEYTLEEEREAGRAMGLEFTGHYGRYRNAQLDRYLNLILASLSAYSDRPGLPCAATVLNSEEAKCLAAPGGLVFITLGCLRVAESESEVAGLLAQALAHSQLRHPLALLEQVRAGARPGAGAKPGEGAKPVTQAEPQEFSAWAEEAAKRLMQQGFALEQVRAASRAATAMLLRLGYEPGGLKVFLARAQVRMLEKSGRLPDVDLGPYKTGGQAVEERLAELHAPVTGRSLTDRYRRECVTCLPAMRR